LSPSSSLDVWKSLTSAMQFLSSAPEWAAHADATSAQ
jgi:hypothetical protein